MPEWKPEIARCLAPLNLAPAREAEIAEELAQHLEDRYQELLASGTTDDQAFSTTIEELKDNDLFARSLKSVEKEKYREPIIQGDATRSFFTGVVQDVRYGLRMLRKSPGFTAVAVLTLALGIGANTAIFTVVDGVILKPLPYPQPERLVMLWETQMSDGTIGSVAPANFFDWREQSHSFEKMAAIDPYPDFILTGSGEPRRLIGAAVSSDFFSLLGVRMALGRDFLPKEDRPGYSQVIVLSYSTWLHYLGGSPDIIGKPTRLNNTAYTVVGVLPRDFSFVSKASDLQSRNHFDVWTPLALPSPPEPWQRGTHPLCVFARLRSGTSLQEAQADLNQVAANLQRLYPADDKERGIAAVPMARYVVGDVRTALFTLLAAVGMLLLIACANIANLLLTRGVTRQKEIAIRIALGASRRRLAQQLLIESTVLAFFGGLLGFSFARIGVPAMLRYMPADLPRTSEIAVDARVLAFTALVSLLTGIVFGLLPLFQFQRVSAHDSLKQSGRGMAPGQSRLRSVLIIGQIAVALVLLTGAGLMTKSFWTLLHVAPGFQTERILTARLSLPLQYTNGNAFGVGQHRRISAFQRELLQRLRSIPGVISAAFTAYLPLSGIENPWAFDIEGRPPKPPGVYDVAYYRPVSAGYFETIGIPILRGRGFDSNDNEDGSLVIIVNESMTRAFWSQEDPLGQRVRLSDQKWRTIVGVVGDVHHEGLGAKPEPEMYIPYGQIPNVESRPTIVLRTSVEPASIASSLRDAVSRVDSTIPMDQIEAMKQILSMSVGQPRFRTAVLFLFAFIALFVASIGLYGVMSYLVAQRTREFGIRTAVGANTGALLRLILGQAARLVIIGISFGLLGAALLAKAMASLLYGITPFDTATFAAMSLLLAVVAFSASYVPARRATRVDPIVALRHE